MSELSYGYVSGASTWWDADLRRHQISQLLHVITPAAAMCIVLSAGPEAMFPPVVSAATWMSWPWNLLLSMVFGVLAWDVRALWLRRRGRRRALSFPVDSVDQAFRFAEDALGVNRWTHQPGGYVGPGSGAGVWETLAVLPLAALAFAASKPQHTDPMQWLTRTVDQLATDGSDRAWQLAAEAVGVANTHLHDAFVRTTNMSQRQRDSLVLVMRDALAPLVAVRR
jgi:hypothetical protein